uniref:Uncharacterized protein n=1 Tax=Oryza rufipogon TaxID=4529 RepID=A0A0E0Q5N3_ORYRU
MQTERDSIGLNANVRGTYLCKSSPQLSAERQTSIDLGAILHKLGSRCILTLQAHSTRLLFGSSFCDIQCAYGDIGLLVWEYFLPCDGLATGTHVRFPTST